MPTLFGRLRRYAFTPGRDAREDRLTEALAATLEAAPAAARRLVTALFADHDSGDELKFGGEARIATQRRTLAGDRIDLQVSFGPEARPTFTAWIEAKVDAPATREQAERYVAAARQNRGPTRVCWLLPVGRPVQGGTPDGVPVCTWQELAATLDTWVGSLSSAEREGYGASLVAEFVRHLEEEQALASTQPFSGDDAAVINQYARSTAKLESILNDARQYVRLEWGELDDTGPTRRIHEFFEHVPTHSQGASPWPWPTEHYFEWDVGLDSAREQPNGEWVVGAGVSFPAATAPRYDDTPWLHRAAALGFEYAPSGRSMVLYRYITLVELAGWGSQHQQARRLGEFLVASFKSVESLALIMGTSQAP